MDVSTLSSPRPRGRPRRKLYELTDTERAARLSRLESKRLAFLPPLDPQQRYTIDEALAYLRTSRRSFYDDVKAGRIALVKDGRRSYVHGSELIRRSAVSRADA